MDAVQGRLGDTAEQAGSERTGGGLAHHLVLVTDGQEEDTGGGAEAGEVPRTHRALDEVVAEALDVQQHDGVDRPVQAQRHHEGVRQRDDDGEDQRGEVVDGLQDVGQTGAGVHTQRADQEGGQRDHDQHRQERHEDQLDVLGDDLAQQLGQRAEDPGHQQRREHLRAVVEDRQRQAEDLHHVDGAAGELHLGRGFLQGGEARQHHDGHDGETDPRVGADLLAGVVGHHQRQEDEHALPGQVDELPRHRERGARVGPVADDAQGAHQ
ncbi:hypothetical protein SDC9_134524 [bioreactor metagenome]|uniref:Uncharacterized protein n=1 Tax=bioreactor metagenome TaxID=1076179 RepID=A0A645DEG1_9ZZZZ